ASRSLRKRALNMSVLISVGVLAAYLFSVIITVLNAGETFYEAAAMLVTFVLFGHWMALDGYCIQTEDRGRVGPAGEGADPGPSTQRGRTPAGYPPDGRGGWVLRGRAQA